MKKWVTVVFATVTLLSFTAPAFAANSTTSVEEPEWIESVVQGPVVV